MEIFVTNAEVAQREYVLQQSRGIERLRLLVTLAWDLRQRDSKLAIMLADEAEDGIALEAITSSPDPKINFIFPRLLLLRSEIAYLHGDIDRAEQLLSSALPQLDTLNRHEAGSALADAYYLQACLMLHRGELAAVEPAMMQSITYATRAQDGLRVRVAESFLANQMVFRNSPLAMQRWGRQFRPPTVPDDSLIASYSHEFQMYVSSLSSNFGQSVACGIQVFECALQYGQVQRAINVAGNIGDAFNSLNDHQAALKWIETGHEIARKTGWPVSIGNCLLQMSETLRRLGRLDAAKDMLEEVLTLLNNVTGSRTHLLALRYLGDLSLDRGDYQAALLNFSLLKQWADQKDYLDFRIGARRGYAHVMSLLDQPDEALSVAHEALTLTENRRDSYRHIDVLRVLASLHTRHVLPSPQEMEEPSASLHYLKQALEIAAEIDGYNVSGDLLEEIADAHAACGNYQEAFRYSRLAIDARAAIHTKEVTNRANAMEVSRQTDRMRAESEHLRQLAKAEAERAEVLAQSSAILERLGTIGQEITASLDAEAVFDALNRHVHGLLHVTAFVIYLMDADLQSMTSAYGVENGQAIESDSIPMSSAVSNSVRSVKERREILVDISPDDEVPGLIPGTERVLSMLFAPLMIGEQVLGVMTIQSSRARAYGDRERMIFRSLSAYGAIALGNADAYLRLKQAQEHLIAQEKLAALGALVAGVAHELNTPIGNCLLVASTLQDSTRDVLQKLKEQNLRRSELNRYCDEVAGSSDILMRSLGSAANLVSSFKQVAVDRTSEQRRPFDLRKVLLDIVATLNIRIGHAGHTLSTDVPEGIVMDSYPGSLGQVITNLIENAILHAFDQGGPGCLMLSAAQVDNARVVIQLTDDGCGIPEGNLKRIFDPFFTTKLGQGGSGLGLHISYNIVTSILHGQLNVKSIVGIGTTFTMDLPMSL
ncbi:ATP-binding protein [Undibacterium sp. SXout7W]|uniref:ATP-binding protein n=1 Tax=Undibacterium sp. SXout7W TaxID=3413049 RepID=UPI003BF441A4